LLRQENEYLIALRFLEINNLQAEKKQLVDFLNLVQEQLKQNITVIDDLTAQEKAEFIALNLDEMVAENKKILSISMQINANILEMIKKSCLDYSNQIAGYNSDGSYGNKFKSANEIPALSLKNYI
jgi:Cft2 family RNA processing exonuclease